MKKIKIILVIVVLVILAWFSLNIKKLNDDEVDSSMPPQKETISIPKNPHSSKQEDLYFDNREKQEKEFLKSLNKPFKFLGKIVDLNGEPISDVKIIYRVSQPKQAWVSNTTLKTIYSDSNGSFTIDGNGNGFSFQNFEKEGYQLPRGQTISFAYSSGAAQPERHSSNITVYTLIKESNLESLITASSQLLLKWDGEPINYSLKTGKLGDVGEVQIIAKRSERASNGKFSWSFKVKIVDGELCETTREKSYLAPLEGYKPYWECGFEASDDKWSSAEGTTYLFFKIQNNTYGRLQINVNSRENRSTISGRIRSYLNPAGSRILE